MRTSLLTYLGFILITIAALFLINTFNIAYPITITTKTALVDLAVVGTGKVTVIPDTATVQVGITVTNAKTVSEAQQKINEVNNKIIVAMEKLGIAKADIKTSNYSINPSYSYANGTNQIDGYNGNATIILTIKDTKILPRVVQEATAAGANQVNDPQYTVNSPEKFREEARNKAIANAKDEAARLAQTLGIRLGKITNIVESQPNSPIPIYMEAQKADSVSQSVPPILESGSQEITSTVTLYFEKK